LRFILIVSVSSVPKLLRTHTSAHQTSFMAKGYRAFLCTGDVYRRDEVDATHYPGRFCMYVHVVALQSQLRRLSFLDQMEGVRLFNIKDLLAASGQEDAATDLQKSREICTVRHMSYTLLSYPMRTYLTASQYLCFALLVVCHPSAVGFRGPAAVAVRAGPPPLRRDGAAHGGGLLPLHVALLRAGGVLCPART